MKKVSVIMGVYNCEATLQQAVKSIMDQTYSNWELILCDDGSRDHTFSLARKLGSEDKRIRIIRNGMNRGLNYTLNHCLQYADGDYIARMDGDDESLPDRFEKQVRFLESHPEFGLVSSTMILFDEKGEWGRCSRKEFPDKEDVITGSPICHAPVMMRRECMEAVGGYTVDPRLLRVEDVDLWIRLYAEGYKCYNIQEPLYRMRNDQNALHRRKYRYRINSTYARLRGCRLLKAGPACYIKSFRPMINGLVPAGIRNRISRIMQAT